MSPPSQSDKILPGVKTRRRQTFLQSLCHFLFDGQRLNPPAGCTPSSAAASACSCSSESSECSESSERMLLLLVVFHLRLTEQQPRSAVSSVLQHFLLGRWLCSCTGLEVQQVVVCSVCSVCSVNTLNTIQTLHRLSTSSFLSHFLHFVGREGWILFHLCVLETLLSLSVFLYSFIFLSLSQKQLHLKTSRPLSSLLASCSLF